MSTTKKSKTPRNDQPVAGQPSLLDLAKAAGPQQPLYEISEQSVQEAELMMAWIMGQVSNNQVATVLGVAAHNSVPTKVGPALREMAKFGRLTMTLERLDGTAANFDSRWQQGS